MLRVLGKYKQDYYFIDYCEIVYKVGHIFVNGEILEEVKDQFDNKFEQTIIGWKLLCKIKNLDNSKLKILKGFDYVENPIVLK